MKKHDYDFISTDDRIEWKLLDHNTHFLFGDIDEDTIEKAIKWITFENFDVSRRRTLTLYINSSGGDLYQAFGQIDPKFQSNSNPLILQGKKPVDF